MCRRSGGFRKLALVAVVACGGDPPVPPDPGPALQVLGESTRWRAGDPLPASSPWFDGTQVMLVAARGETLGLQVFHPAGEVSLRVDGATVSAFAVDSLVVARPSTGLFGGSLGEGRYPEGLRPAIAPATNPAYFEVAIAGDAAPGARTGELVIGERTFPVTLAITTVTLPPPRLDVWAYFDQRELAWASGAGAQPAKATVHRASDAERACIAMFRAHGVLLSPDMPAEAFAERRELLFDFPYVPATLPADPAAVGDAVRAWIAATAGTGKVPFAIPIDEPKPEAREKVRALADAARAAGAGPGTFLFAVTDEPRPEYGDSVDLYIQWNAAHLAGDRHLRWTYNGKPPRAGSLVLDAQTPGTRTWGWIAHRYKIPVWYVWDALYWHDRHNRKGAPPPGRTLDPATDSVSFDDGDDRGNLDGVLALPGCKRTLRLAAIRRGLHDRQLLEAAAVCDPAGTAALAATLIPRALGDAPADGEPAWPTDEASWERARRQLLVLASCRP
ncbi:MAG: hypothetical protein ABI867_09295 [Kofleriaceae bacterium]